MGDLPDHVTRNRAHWDQWASEYEAPGRRNWAIDEPSWGIWGVPESEVGMLPPYIAGADVIELGCGTGYVSAWLARRGARPVGIDNSEAHLETAKRFQREFGLEFPLLHGNAEDVPLIFLVNAALLMLCAPDEEDRPASDQLLRPYFGMHRFEWSDDDSVEFHLPHGEMVGLLRRSGFELEELIEIRPPDRSTTRYPFVTLEWAQKWPCEEVWKARKTS